MTVRQRLILWSILLLDIIVLVFEVNSLSISVHEVDILLKNETFFAHFINFVLSLFAQNDIVLRTPLILLHLFSSILIYKLLYRYLKNRNDSLIGLIIFVLLPGVHSSALLVDSAGLVLFILLLYIYLFEKSNLYKYGLLLLFLFVDESFAYLYLGLLFYALTKRDTKLLVTSLLLFTVSMYYFGFDDGGVPFGYFLDNLGIYSIIFSPPIFVYMVYTLYRRLILREIDITLILSSTALIISLMFSIRQNVHIETFAPFLVLSLPLILHTFLTSYRIRLKQFRKSQKQFFYFTMGVLIINFFVVLFNKEIYKYLDTPQKHFAYRLHVAKELADELKNVDIECIKINDNNMQKRLWFYGINNCKDNYEVAVSDKKSQNVTVSYNNIEVYSLNVSN